MTNQDGRIVVTGLTKTYGTLRAVDDLSFTVEPGTITGFLGPNGAGKTTTLRMLLGLITPDAGTATISGHPYAALPAPSNEVGAVLEASGFHPARSGRNHLRVYCTVNGYPPGRADQVLALVGLADAGRRPVRGYSLGMRQRLALATALLGDPGVLILDEPANGLDPEGIAWLRHLLRGLGGQGRTVLVSSHVLSEVQQLVDRVVILHHGRLVRQGALSELAGRQAWVSVRTPQPDELLAALARTGVDQARIQRTGPDRLWVTGLTAADVGRLALAERVELHQLTTEHSDLEQTFFALTAGADQPPSPPSRRRADMGRLITAEFHKLFTTRLWLWLLLGSIALTALYASLAIAFGDSPDNPTPPLASPAGQRTVFSVGQGAGTLLAVLAAIGLTGEFRHQTATTTFLATPNRGRIVLAKLATYALVGIGYALVCIAVTLAVALPWLAANGIHVPLTANGIPATLAGVVAAVATFGLIGIGLGALVREQVATVVGLLVYLFIAEPILTRIPALGSRRLPPTHPQRPSACWP